MTREEVIQLARATVEKEGWRWEEPIRLRKIRRFVFFGRRRWLVITNANYMGCNAWIRIDDETGEVVQKGFWPR